MENRIYDSRDDVKKLILSVVKGDVKEVELLFNNIKYYIDICKSLDIEECGIEVEKRWVTVEFYKDGVGYYLFGNMFDSKHLTFYTE